MINKSIKLTVKNTAKIILALFICLLSITLIGCESVTDMKIKANVSQHFTGVVVRSYDDFILVHVNDGDQARISSDLINVPLDTETGMVKPIIGDNVIICYDGALTETYPPQLSTVFEIKLLSPGIWSDVAAIGISRHVMPIYYESELSWRITNNHQIDWWRQWFNGLSLENKLASDGKYYNFEIVGSVGLKYSDLLGGDDSSYYYFTLFQENGDRINFAYGEYDKNNGILFYDGEWYEVSDPAYPISLHIDTINDNPVDFSAFYVKKATALKTNGMYPDSPVVTIIKSRAEYDRYIEENFRFRWGNEEDPVMETEYIDLIDSYPDGFFTDNYLAIIYFHSGIKPIEYQVASVNAEGDIFIMLMEAEEYDLYRETGLRSLIIELENNFAPQSFNIALFWRDGLPNWHER